MSGRTTAAAPAGRSPRAARRGRRARWSRMRAAPPATCAQTGRSARTDTRRSAARRTAPAERAAATTAPRLQAPTSSHCPADEDFSATRLRHPVVQRDDRVDDIEADVLRLIRMQSALGDGDGAKQRWVALDRRQLDLDVRSLYADTGRAQMHRDVCAGRRVGEDLDRVDLAVRSD